MYECGASSASAGVCEKCVYEKCTSSSECLSAVLAEFQPAKLAVSLWVGPGFYLTKDGGLSNAYSFGMCSVKEPFDAFLFTSWWAAFVCPRCATPTADGQKMTRITLKETLDKFEKQKGGEWG